jgi:trans-aconitate 2-methyltransferase
MAWNPKEYAAFEAERLRPATELLARVPRRAPRTIVDLGCGTGTATRLLADRWPEAAVTGVDDSEAMLETARDAVPGVGWERRRIEQWQPSAPLDLLFSNAALHWLDDHPGLFRRLARQVAPDGCLAVQMPRNFGAPSHVLAQEVAEGGPWREKLRPLLRPDPVAAPEEYYALLRPLARRLDLWETRYLHVLRGEDPVLAWARGSLLVPLLGALEEADRARFEAEYREKVRGAYPPNSRGETLFPFRRLFLVASF